MTDILWTPIIGHYRGGQLDAARIEAQVAAIKPSVSQYLIAGTTGDGWQLDDALIEQWIDLCASPAFAGCTLLFGAFGATTDEVIARARMIEERVAAAPLAGTFAGLTICAPVNADATQDEIAAHIRAVLTATTAPMAVYQLPQIVGCTIAAETFSALATENPRIAWFKDTSGKDAVIDSGLPHGSALYLRGAEGRYAEALAQGYDGWLLSTSNGFAAELREIATLAAAGDPAVQARSGRLAGIVEAVFALAAPLGGNAFADAARAVDHLRAYGDKGDSQAAERLDGSTLPPEFVRAVRGVLADAGIDTRTGYLV